MRGLLVRVGIDSSDDGRWNGPVDSKSGRFVYVPIAETKPLRLGSERLYDELRNPLATLGQVLPSHLQGQRMHLDPNFATLTYGDQGRRASRLSELASGDLLVFYASLRDISDGALVYALIGLFVIDEIVAAANVPRRLWADNAHTRRLPGATDIVVRAKPNVSGRLERCISIGEYRNRAYRVTIPVLNSWRGLKVKDGWLQRSARLPELENAAAFYDWFKRAGIRLVRRNN